MAKKTQGESSNRRIRPAMTPEAREQQLIALAVNLAEQQLLDGTASSQVITHYLKLASSREKIEQELLEKKVALATVQKEAIESEQRLETLYEEAIAAMKRYSGNGDDEDYGGY